MPSCKTDYKNLWKRAVRECMVLHNINGKLAYRLTETSRTLIVLKDLVDDFIPKERYEEFKKELDKRFKKAELDLSDKKSN